MFLAVIRKKQTSSHALDFNGCSSFFETLCLCKLCLLFSKLLPCNLLFGLCNTGPSFFASFLRGLARGRNVGNNSKNKRRIYSGQCKVKKKRR
jgi:hypothetical protein